MLSNSYLQWCKYRSYTGTCGHRQQRPWTDTCRPCICYSVLDPSDRGRRPTTPTGNTSATVHDNSHRITSGTNRGAFLQTRTVHPNQGEIVDCASTICILFVFCWTVVPVILIQPSNKIYYSVQHYFKIFFSHVLYCISFSLLATNLK